MGISVFVFQKVKIVSFCLSAVPSSIQLHIFMAVAAKKREEIITVTLFLLVPYFYVVGTFIIHHQLKYFIGVAEGKVQQSAVK